MSVTLVNYHTEIERGIIALEAAYAAIERDAKKDANPDFHATNWDDLLWSIQEEINNLHVMGAIHMFERLSKVQMQALFAAQTRGESTGKIIVPIEHALRTFDTLRSLQLEYGVPWQDVLVYNNVAAKDFSSQATIKIPLPVDISSRAKNIPVFGDQSERNILGRDLPNELIEDSSGDLKVLGPEDTFVQAMNNLAQTLKGDLAYYEEYGLDLRVGEDWPSEAYDAAIQLRISQGFQADPRVKALKVLDVLRQGVSLNIKVEIEALQGPAIIVSTNP